MRIVDNSEIEWTLRVFSNPSFRRDMNEKLGLKVYSLSENLWGFSILLDFADEKLGFR